MRINFKMMGAAIACLFVAACSNVPAGHVGVVVNKYGSDKGVETEVRTPGRYWLGWYQDMFVFPTFAVNYPYTKATLKESPGDESFTFQDVDGLPLNADIAVTFSVEANKVPVLFQRYRQGVNEIKSSHLKNAIRDELNRVASNRKVEELYGTGRAQLLDEVATNLRREYAAIGINIERISWLGEIRLPEVIKTAIDNKIAAIQRAQQRENEIQETRAQAQKAIEEAKGEAQSRILRAEAEADANRRIAQSITPELVKYFQAQKWNGVLPMYTGSGVVPFLDVSDKK
jgi:regulator of protease activity HflC (stomatin/prohibitin superfamily)